MHWNLVPTEEELAALERSVSLLPSPKQILTVAAGYAVELRESTRQQSEQVQALRVVVQLPPIHRQPRGVREGAW